MASRLTVQRGTAARVLGIGVRTFERLEQLGVVAPLTLGKRGKASTYDLAVVVPAYLRHQQNEKPEAPKDRRDRSQAELNELRLARERSLLLPREQVVSDGQAFVTAAVTKFRAVPPAAVQRGLVAPEKAVQLEDLVEEAIDEMSRWSSALELLQVVDEEAPKA